MAKAAKKKSTAKNAKQPAKKRTKSASRGGNGSSRRQAAKSPTGREPAAIQLLKQDHRTVEDLFEEFEQSSKPRERRDIAAQICQELTIHTMIEEEIFYPAVKDVVEDEIYGEAHVEHDGAKVLIAEIMAADPSDEFYDARVKVLSEMIKHHVKEEEQPGGMFAQVRSNGGDIDFDELAERLQTRKEDLTRVIQRNGVPAPEARTMHGAKVRLGQPVA